MDRCESTTATGRVFCPKPRRVGSPNVNIPAVPLRFHTDEVEAIGAKQQINELLGLMLRKDDSKAAAPFSPPYFFGSPPCRTHNPVTLDAHFGINKLNPTVCSSPEGSTSLPTVRVRFGQNQAAVRVEGFNCQNSHVATSMG